MRRRAPLPIDCIEAYAQRKLFCKKNLHNTHKYDRKIVRGKKLVTCHRLVIR